MRVGIIGAGISGLSIGQMLKRYFDVEVLEKDNKVGGIAKTKTINGVAYHLVGGHCFNSKNINVLNFVFTNILPKSEWHLVERKAKIFFKGHLIDYPIEFSVKQIACFNEELAFNITKDFFATKDDKNPENLADWFIQKFGKTLAEEYFIPYNRKIWNQDPYKMDYIWVKDKLPIPDKKSFFLSLVKSVRDDMPHSYFFYPNSNDQ
ncbi:NAD(P)-binding protein [Desulfurobacterium sp. TC5-1]|uniref:NAD(P)-binding protein n=1 Tax=Desulfurobacterium sp. TC5-1 TaxID=1158318 RepID=UPI0003FA71CA|nr:NAD(P)-binding protein [Desulfurobacterium sp. TC5-1]